MCAKCSSRLLGIKWCLGDIRLDFGCCWKMLWQSLANRVLLGSDFWMDRVAHFPEERSLWPKNRPLFQRRQSPSPRSSGCGSCRCAKTLDRIGGANLPCLPAIWQSKFLYSSSTASITFQRNGWTWWPQNQPLFQQGDVVQGFRWAGPHYWSFSIENEHL